MERCYQYFECPKEKCPAYNLAIGEACWDIPETLCNGSYMEKMLEYGHNKCDFCIYYKEKKDMGT